MNTLLRARGMYTAVAVLLCGMMLAVGFPTSTVQAVPQSVDASASVLEWMATSPAGADVTLDASASSDEITHFAWFEAGVLLAEGEIATVLLPIGSHEIILEATTDGSDWTAAAPITVTVSDVPPVANAGPDQTLDATGDLTDVVLDGSASTGAISYSWSIDGTEVATDAVATVGFPAGTTEVTLTVLSVGGVTATDTMTVTINPAAVEEHETSVVDDAIANPGATQLVWEATSADGADVTLDGSLASDDADQYAWREGCSALPCAPETLLAEVRTAAVPLAIGDHEITLFVHVAGVWYVSTPIIVTVNPLPDEAMTAAVPTATFSPSRATVGSTVSYQISQLRANTMVDITLLRADSTPITHFPVTSDASGNVSGSFTVPATPGGALQIRVTDGYGTSITADFEVVPRIKVIPGTVKPGDTVNVALSGFGKNETVRIRWLINGAWVTVGTVVTSTNGSANTYVVVPSNVAPGANSVRADGTLFRAQTNAVTVDTSAVPTARVWQVRRTVNSRVSYEIKQFPVHATVAIELVRIGAYPISIGTVTTDASGYATGRFTVPATPGGAVQIRFTAGTIVASADFEVVPKIRPIPDPAQRGDTVDVSLRGFGKGETVRIRWLVDGAWVQVAMVTTSNTGSANVNAVVPANAPIGLNSVRGDGTLFSAQIDTFIVQETVTPAVTINPTRGTVNSAVAYNLTGLPANAPVTLTWIRPGGSTVSLWTVNTDGSGEASGFVGVPATTGGPDNRIVFTSGSTVLSLNYDVAPRIMVPWRTVELGEAVEIWLSGYGKHETVRIRWLVNGTWVTIGTVETSNTGSANIILTVPMNVTPGPNSVRGDGTVYRAQTNAVTVVES